MRPKINIPPQKHRTWAEIDLDNAEYNFKMIKQRVQGKICCVVKANAYGHGAEFLSELYQSLGADYLAVSNIEEALKIRNRGVILPILILGVTDTKCAKILSDKNITQTVVSREYGVQLSESAVKYGVKVNVHIKLDSGMGRLGFLCRGGVADEIDDAVFVCKLRGLYPEGVFTHFAVSDEGENGEKYTREQFGSFMNAVAHIEACGVKFHLKHCSNSAAIFDYPEFHLDMVRAGISLYGLKPSNSISNLPTLRPVMKVCSVITQIKMVYAGESVSYGRNFTAERDIRIAVVPIGYADGFRRYNEAAGYKLLINGRSAPIIGRICMDRLMTDVTEIECEVGDEVTVFGGSELFTADILADINNTINYEIVCNVGDRVPRLYVKDGKISEDNISPRQLAE